MIADGEIEALSDVIVNQHFLGKFHLEAEEILSDYEAVLSDAELSSTRSDILRGLCFKMRTWLLCKEHQVEQRGIHEPLNFWEMFKRDWFPNWFLRRFPVRMVLKETIIIKIAKICPHIALKLPKDKYVHFDYMIKL